MTYSRNGKVHPLQCAGSNETLAVESNCQNNNIMALNSSKESINFEDNWLELHHSNSTATHVLPYSHSSEASEISFSAMPNGILTGLMQPPSNQVLAEAPQTSTDTRLILVKSHHHQQNHNSDAPISENTTSKLPNPISSGEYINFQPLTAAKASSATSQTKSFSEDTYAGLSENNDSLLAVKAAEYEHKYGVGDLLFWQCNDKPITNSYQMKEPGDWDTNYHEVEGRADNDEVWETHILGLESYSESQDDWNITMKEVSANNNLKNDWIMDLTDQLQNKELANDWCSSINNATGVDKAEKEWSTTFHNMHISTKNEWLSNIHSVKGSKSKEKQWKYDLKSVNKSKEKEWDFNFQEMLSNTIKNNQWTSSLRDVNAKCNSKEHWKTKLAVMSYQNDTNWNTDINIVERNSEDIKNWKTNFENILNERSEKEDDHWKFNFSEVDYKEENHKDWSAGLLNVENNKASKDDWLVNATSNVHDNYQPSDWSSDINTVKCSKENKNPWNTAVNQVGAIGDESKFWSHTLNDLIFERTEWNTDINDICYEEDGGWECHTPRVLPYEGGECNIL